MKDTLLSTIPIGLIHFEPSEKRTTSLQRTTRLARSVLYSEAPLYDQHAIVLTLLYLSLYHGYVNTGVDSSFHIRKLRTSAIANILLYCALSITIIAVVCR